jgi:hypothetical protein
MVASRLGTSRSIADAIDGSPNSIVAETRDAVVSADGWSGINGGFSAANAVPVKAAVLSSTKAA